jgi:hypothetical protein
MSRQNVEVGAKGNWRDEWHDLPIDVEFYKEMTALRDQAIAEGMKLMTIEEIRDYVRECRGGSICNHRKGDKTNV